MDRTGVIDQERAGPALFVGNQLPSDDLPELWLQFFRYIPQKAGDPMGIQRDVGLVTADVAVPFAGKDLFLLRFSFTDGYGNAGVGNGVAVQTWCKP